MSARHNNFKKVATFVAMLFAANVQASKQDVDTIIQGDYVVPMDAQDRVIEQGAVAIDDGVIVAVGESSKILADYQSASVINGDGKILMPGLVNGHTHTSMTLFRGMIDDLDLMDWLTNYVFPMEGKFVDAEFIRTGTELACYEMIQSGTTTFVDMYFHPDVIADVVIDCGLRAVVGSPAIDFPSPGFKGWDDSFAAAVDFVSRRQGKHERVIAGFAPHAPYTVSAEHLKQVADKAKAMNAPITMHLAEAPSETAIIKERYNDTPVSHVAKLGVLDHRLIAAHTVHPTAEEIKLLASKPVGAIHNPTSNLKLAAGISPVSEMLEAGVSVGLGTDGAASNNDLDLWEDMRLAALIHKQRTGDPKVVPASTALRMATSMGAEAIGLANVTGKLAKGYKADMIQVDYTDTRLAPMYNVISHLVYTIDSQDVTLTMVSGKVLMQDRKVLTLDSDTVRAKANAKAAEISAALNR